MTHAYLVDSFTNEPFAGNPAGVCLLESWPETAWLMAVAGEIKASETAFLVPREEGYHLRWFTPEVEVELCGHATLASAHILTETGRVQEGERVRFHTLSGWLAAAVRGDWIEMDFPADPPMPTEETAELEGALGLTPHWVGKGRFDYLVELGDEATVRELRPDLARLAELDARGVIVTAPSQSSDYDFVSRFFAPAVGVPEDPVTGSAHCTLAPYWSGKLGKTELVGHQVSARGGVVRVQMQGDRVQIGGQAVTIWRGELLV